jgi:hypothetical protein
MSREDLDNIFAKAKKTNDKQHRKSTKATGSGNVTKIVEKSGPTKSKSKKPDTASKKAGSSSDPFGLTPSTKNDSLDYTEEGWRIYTPDELGIGKGGDTAECPFDCKCCF